MGSGSEFAKRRRDTAACRVQCGRKAEENSRRERHRQHIDERPRIGRDVRAGEPSLRQIGEAPPGKREPDRATNER